MCIVNVFLNYFSKCWKLFDLQFFHILDDGFMSNNFNGETDLLNDRSFSTKMIVL